MNNKYETPCADTYTLTFEQEISKSVFIENKGEITTTPPDGVFDIIV